MRSVVIPSLLVACGIVYNLLAIAGALRFRRRVTIPDFAPPVSILKPVRGCDPQFYKAIRSHAEQCYPNFEILFGIADPDDPAHQVISTLQRDYPGVPIRVI